MIKTTVTSIIISNNVIAPVFERIKGIIPNEVFAIVWNKITPKILPLVLMYNIDIWIVIINV